MIFVHAKEGKGFAKDANNLLDAGQTDFATFAKPFAYFE
jgi:hypothetical protein